MNHAGTRQDWLTSNEPQGRAMTVPQRINTIASSDRLARAILAVYVPFALGGAAAETGRAGRILFAALYIVSAIATPWLLMTVRGSLPQARPVRRLAMAASVLLALAAVGHATEAVAVLAHPGLSVAHADKQLGGVSGLVAGAGVGGLILGTLLLCVTLWRAGLTRPWPTVLFVLVLPAQGLPHGAAQQLTRSLIVLAVAAWLALSTITSYPTGRRTRTYPVSRANQA